MVMTERFLAFSNEPGALEDGGGVSSVHGGP